MRRRLRVVRRVHVAPQLGGCFEKKERGRRTVDSNFKSYHSFARCNPIGRRHSHPPPTFVSELTLSPHADTRPACITGSPLGSLPRPPPRLPNPTPGMHNGRPSGALLNARHTHTIFFLSTTTSSRRESGAPPPPSSLPLRSLLDQRQRQPDSPRHAKESGRLVPGGAGAEARSSQGAWVSERTCGPDKHLF